MPRVRRPGAGPALHVVLGEVLGLIAEARRQLTAGGPRPDAATFRTAEDELGAVVEQSAQAAETILSACEELDHLTASAPDPDGALRACTMRIFEACAFQDLVAQRVKRIASLIREIEERLDGIVDPTEVALAAPAQASLTNGPALPQEAPGQDEIDRLFGANG